MTAESRKRKKNKLSNQTNDSPNINVSKGKTDKTEEPIQSGSTFQKFLCYMYEEDDASYLAVFRIMWGLIMADEIFGHVKNNFAKTMDSFYQSEFAYKYYGLEWCVAPSDPFVLKVFMVIMLVLAIFITIGFLYRISAILFATGFLYIFGLEAALYLNHFYLVVVMAFMLCFLPCNVYFSVDALLFPNVARKTVPKWCLWTIRAELWIVYTYAGVAKINIDWMRGEPLRHWLIKRMYYPIIGQFLQYEPIIYWFSWSGLIYDLIVGTLLVFPQTFYIGLSTTLFFHLTNKYLFNIGIFPWLMIATTSLYFEPYWPRRFFYYIKEYSKKNPKPFTDYAKPSWKKTKVRALSLGKKLMLLFVFLFLMQQLLTPIRHHFYPGNVFWNEHGHRYSWRMKLRDKQCDGELYTYIPETREWFEFPLNNVLTPRHYQKFTSRPEFIAQSVQLVQHHLEKANNNSNRTLTPELYCYVACRVNYREAAMLTNPRYNLANIDVWSWPYEWIEEMPELTEEQAAEIPWNFEWNFNWLFKPWESNRERLKMEQQNNLIKMEELAASWADDFRNFIITEKFNGDEKLADSKFRKFVNQEHKQMQRERANKGLLLHI